MSAMPVPLTLFSNRTMLDHDQGPHHPERPERLSAILEAFERHPLQNVVHRDPISIDQERLELVHDPDYVRSLIALTGRSTTLDADTRVSPGSIPAARLAAGAVADAVHAVMTGASTRAFALVRPPGHHAEHDRAMGFCLFNNVAVGAVQALQDEGAQRVLVVDWDVHHGNGTQHTFDDDEQVLVFNTHQWPLYPGTGSRDEVGRGNGRGFTVNVPLPGGCGDGDYAAVYNELLSPIAEQYLPDLILISAGYDAHRDDPLGNMRVTTAGFASLCGIVRSLADRLCGGRLVLTLEGGYHIQALAQSVRACAAVLSEEAIAVPVEAPASVAGRDGLERAKAVQREFWRV